MTLQPIISNSGRTRRLIKIVTGFVLQNFKSGKGCYLIHETSVDCIVALVIVSNVDTANGETWQKEMKQSGSYE
jgi:hypothetical protein